jgi:hypothetical protein
MTTTLTEKQSGVQPATVLAIAGDRLRLKTDEGDVWGHMALAYPYQPVRGDVLLVAGEEPCYVIGVLRGSGRTVLSVQGDLELRATGQVAIASSRSIRLEAPDISIRGDRFEVAVRAAFERFMDCYRDVKNCLHLTAGRTRTVVEESYDLQAGQITQIAEKTVVIDGREIHLG